MTDVGTEVVDPPRKPKRKDPGDELPDPRRRPIAPPEPERVVPPRLAAMKSMGGGGTLGLEVALSVIVGLFGGQWLDGYFGTAPWIMVAGFGFGVAAAIRAVMRQTRIMKREALKEEAAEGNPAPLWESDGERARREQEEKRERAELDADADASTDGAKASRKDEP